MLHVSVLGEQAITDDGTGVRTRSSRAVALVAFLAVHAGVPQARQRIAGLFWPDSTDAQALTNLRRELHHLRQVLGDERSLVVTARDLCWRDTATCRVDVRAFDTERRAALAAAAAGDDEAVLVHARRGDRRVPRRPAARRVRRLAARGQAELERQCVDLCDLVCAARTRAGDLAGAVERRGAGSSCSRWRRPATATLMQLQADLGDRAGAVSTYHHCASVLERELGVHPGRRDAHRRSERLIAHAAPRGRTGRPGRRPRHRPLRRRRRLRWSAGRRSSAVLERAVAGRGRGQRGPGAGPRRRRRREDPPGRRGRRTGRQQGAVVASTRCFGASGRLALAPVADWLRNPAVQSAAATLDPAWRAEVDRLVPAGRPRDATRPERDGDAWQRHRFFEGLARALLAVGRPMLLVLDNMQWCDQETLAFITFFLGLAADAPAAGGRHAARRRPRDDPRLADWTVRMRATGLLTELPLTPLEAADTARLAEAISGAPLRRRRRGPAAGDDRAASRCTSSRRVRSSADARRSTPLAGR